MKKDQKRALAVRFSQQHGVISRSEARALGVTPSMERRQVDSGEWERPLPRVIRLAGSRRTSEQDLMISLLEMGPSAVASHQSAAWLWGFGPVPDHHAVTVGRGVRWRSGGFAVHRLTEVPERISFRSNIPCTNPLRTLVDLAGVVSSDRLDDAIDAAIARKLVTVEAVESEMGRLSQHGRKGVGALRRALDRRGLVEPPHPSVLESRLYRLFRQGGIEPLGVEVVAGDDGQYRIDSVLDPAVAVEVDGHVHHSTPEQKAADERRRAELRLSGIFLLVYDWRAITRDGRRVLKECQLALARYGTGTGRLATG